MSELTPEIQLRDAQWCAALLNTLKVDDVLRVLRQFNNVERHRWDDRTITIEATQGDNQRTESATATNAVATPSGDTDV